MKVTGLFIVGGLLLAGIGAEWAMNLPEAKVTIVVKDPEKKPVEGVEVNLGGIFSSNPEVIKRGESKGLTDKNGRFVAQVKCSDEVGYNVRKAGYYENFHSRYLFRQKKDGRWLPWNPTFEVIIKPIKNPIPMYAKQVRVEIPQSNVRLGYDFIMGDWLPPHGKGKIADLVVFEELRRVNNDDYDSKLMISFSNKGDGLQTFEAPFNQGSVLKSVYEAPVDGYLSEWTQRHSRHPGQPSVYDCDEKRNYYFRLRTVSDEQGKVKTALYGKIYGDFMVFSYYLNPTPNDRNVEFDVEKNLLKKLQSFEQPKLP